MKKNIFQKISLLIYCIFIISILCFFVPYKRAYLDSDLDTYSSILSNYGREVDLVRLFFFLVIPTLIYFFSTKSLAKMNHLDINAYRRKAKTEIYFFLIFLFFNLTCISYMYGMNFISEMKQVKYNSEIKELQTQIDKVNEDLNFRDIIYDKMPYVYDGYTWTKDVFLSYIDNEEGFKEEIYEYLQTNNQIDITELEFNQKIVKLSWHNVIDLEKKYDELNNQITLKSALLKEISFFSSNFIKYNVALSLFGSFLLLYIVRYFFLFVNGMFLEINQK